jgi:hypothetical protein
MAAVTATIAAGTALAGLGMSVGQAVKAQKDKKAAQSSAAQAASAIRDMKEVNAYEDLQVPTLGFDLAQQGLDKATMASLQTAQGAGAEGVIGGVGRINEAQNAQELKLAAMANDAEFGRDKLVAGAQQDINSNKFEQLSELEFSRLSGAQQEAYAAEMRKQKAIEGAFGSATSALGFAADAVPLYKTISADKQFLDSGDKLASWAPKGTYSSVDAQGNKISTNVKPANWMSDTPGLNFL